MSGKNQYPVKLDWQSTDPTTTLFPIVNNSGTGGSIPSGTKSGTMSGTSTIYSNIVEFSKMDNIGLEIDWTGTPTGTITIYTSISGINWHSMTFSPVLAQPAGAAGGYNVSLNQVPFKYFYIKYTNASGSGSLTVSAQFKDLN